MNDNNKGRGIFYGVIGVATLVVAIIGATFAYFTATASNNTTITGDTAKVELGLTVTKISTADEKKGGMIPLANSMVQRAVYGKTDGLKTVIAGDTPDICVDDNGNAVCQIYAITVTNNSTTGVFVDGYVSLKGGSGSPNDYEYRTGINNKFQPNRVLAENETNNAPAVETTMRWAQVIKTHNDGDNKDHYSTAGDLQLGTATTEKVTFTSIGLESDDGTNAKNTANIRDKFEASETSGVSNGGILGKLAINGTDQVDVINKNYIRVSDHDWKTDSTSETYQRDVDMTSALVYNNFLGTTDTTKSKTFHIVVWLTENGENQTAKQANTPTGAEFFSGNVTFVSAEGNEVSASFQSYARVTSS